MDVFELRLLPASDGDCMILTWGTDDKLAHMVVDGGRSRAYTHLRPYLETFAAAGETLALYLLTHIDADHIEGALAYTRDPARPLDPGDVWYNGFEEMRRVGTRGERQGDQYTAAIKALGWSLNRHFTDGVASIENALETISIEGLKITMLSPDADHLAAMERRWSNWRGRNVGGFAPRSGTEIRARSPMPVPLVVEDLIADGPTDPELPNGSSIAFVAEWGGKRVLLTGDAHPDALASALEPLARGEGGRYRVDVLKVSHHGSKKNTSRKLTQLLDCRRFAISTNGNIHDHPDPEAIAQLLSFSPEGPKRLYFNYDSDRTTPWGADDLMQRHTYSCRWPEGVPGEIVIDLMSED